MKPINTNDLRKIDLNLALVFYVIHSEKSVTGAANRLFLTQPAISASLAKLRDICGDAIFVRQGRAIRATPFADQLAATFKPALATLQSGFTERQAFNPKTSTGIVRVGLLDDIETALLPALSRDLRVNSPGIKLSVRATDFRSLPEQLEREQVDVAVGVFDELPSGVIREPLLQANFRCLFDPKFVKVGRALTLRRYLELEHVLVSFNGDFQGMFEEKFASTSHRRNIVLNTPRFSTLPFVIKGTPLLATVPEYLAYRFARTYDLATIGTPFSDESFSLEMVWPSYLDAEADQQWLRTRIKKLVRLQELVG
jgi:LysR family transcriptional regulator, mexEF-oprN operon transcriptional activator